MTTQRISHSRLTVPREPSPDAGSAHADEDDPRHVVRVARLVRRSTFALLSTVSDAGRPHAAGVAISTEGPTIWVHTMRSSRKARNVGAGGRAAVVIPVRRLPVGPPFTIQFQATASIVSMDDDVVVDLVGRGRLRSITAHGELDEPDGCLLRIEPRGTVHTFGLGVSTIGLMRDPLHVGARSITSMALRGALS